MTPLWDMLMTGVNTQKLYTFIIYLLIFVAQIIIAILSYPIAIRLAAEIYKQVLKYKRIVQQHSNDEDVIQYIAYYDHFKIIYCLILSLIFYLTFIIITNVNCAYMLYLYNGLNNDAYTQEIPTTINTLIPEFRGNYKLKYLSIPTDNYVLYAIEALTCLSYDCVLLFAALFIYQITCYLQKREFSLCFFLKIFIIRVAYELFWNSNILYWIINSVLTSFQVSKHIRTFVVSFYVPFPLFRRLIQLFENGIVSCASFALIRVAIRTIKEKEISHRGNLSLIREIGVEQFRKVELSIKLFRVFCIGFIITLFLQLLTSVLECHFIFLFGSFDSNYKEDQLLNTQVVVGIFTGLISLITPLLYILFLWKLWFFFGKVFGKNNKYRYRIEDFRQLHVTPANLLNTPHHTKLPNEDRIILSHHFVTILITSLLISGFCSQFLSLRSTTPLTLASGDFILTNESGSVLECDGWLEYSFYYTSITHLDPVPYQNQFTYKNPTCLDSINFYTSPIKSYNQEQQVIIDNITVIYYTSLWLPQGSYIHNISDCAQKMIVGENDVPFPCYIPKEFIYSPQADKLCHHYYRNLTKPPVRFEINNTICEESRISCTTSRRAIYTLSCPGENPCPNQTMHYSINRPVMKGGSTSQMCDFHNISNCNSNQFSLITNKLKNSHFSKEDHYPGYNPNLCLFTAVCHYPLWIPLLACIGILAFFLAYAVISLVLIHRYLT